MPRLFSLPIKDEMRFARLAGGGDFDQSIAILADGLAAATDDVSRLDLIERIGLCHWGARRPGDAIETLNKALAISPNSFFSLKLLSECHAMKDEHDTAAAFARRALEAYPEPLPKVPGFYLRVCRGIVRLFPKYRDIFKDVEANASDPERDTRAWYAWAKAYLKWYDETRGTSVTPKLH